MSRLTLIVILATTACVGENVISVKGIIADPEPCQLELRGSEGQPLLESALVHGDFTESFVVSPYRRTHFVTIVCAGSPVASADVGSDHYLVPYDFGTISAPK
jgi:hypothetical protein